MKLLKPKPYLIGEILGWTLARMVDLMYQNRTASHFLRGLVSQLLTEMTSRGIEKEETR
jgi:hypothetical protein